MGMTAGKRLVQSQHSLAAPFKCAVGRKCLSLRDTTAGCAGSFRAVAAAVGDLVGCCMGTAYIRCRIGSIGKQGVTS